MRFNQFQMILKSLVLFFWVPAVDANDVQISIELKEREPSQELITKVASAFRTSSQITVNYIPVHTIGYAPVTKEDILSKWDYQFSFHCPSLCERNASLIQKYLKSGLRQAVECPGPYNAVVDLRNNSDLIFRAYIDSSGRCFTLGETSYFAKDNFNQFLPAGALYPAFTRP